MKKSLQLTVSLLAICSTVSFALANKKIEQIFSYDMIGTDITYLESIVGVARITDTTLKTKKYIIDDCAVTVGYNENSINTLSVEIGNQCNFNLKEILPFEKNISTNEVVFGLASPVTYYSDCLGSCGNAYEPSNHELYVGSKFEDNRELLLSSDITSYESTFAWRETMEKSEGEGWVLDNQFNCQPEKYNDIAAQGLKGQKVTKIMIGYDLETVAQLNFGCDRYKQDINPPQSTTAISSNDSSFHSMPFQVIYKEDFYSHYIGSQIIKGQLAYAPDELYGYHFEFTVDQDNLNKIPVLDTGRIKIKSFILNQYINMNPEQVTRASHFLGIKTDLNDPKFSEKNCGIRGPITLQATNIDFDDPEESEYYAGIKALRVLESGPFKVSCEE